MPTGLEGERGVHRLFANQPRDSNADGRLVCGLVSIRLSDAEASRSTPSLRIDPTRRGRGQTAKSIRRSSYHLPSDWCGGPDDEQPKQGAGMAILKASLNELQESTAGRLVRFGVNRVSGWAADSQLRDAALQMVKDLRPMSKWKHQGVLAAT